MQFITRECVRANRDKVFLFGDNPGRRGFGGQAKAMRGEPNAIGVPTKKRPSMDSDAFFVDAEFEKNKTAIDRVFRSILRHPAGTIIVIPSAGLRTGLAEMQTRAPVTLVYLNLKLRELENLT